ncbi:MAG TPA: SIS domain-containing protein [Candidatus Paceibacterota bacterium]
MHDSILQFATQLSFKPEIKNGPADAHGLPAARLQERGQATLSAAQAGKKIVFAGMGGSSLAASLLKIFDPFADVVAHRDYGLPSLSQETLAESLLIASSYSGNTEETIDFAEHVLRIGLRPAVIASGGKLLKMAEEERLPYIRIPDTVIMPRVAVGLSLVALAGLVSRTDLLQELERVSSMLVPANEEDEGKRIGRELSGFIPLVYSSVQNGPVAYNWKIKINETAKTPVFVNVFSELNHNELAGFTKNEKGPKGPFKVLFIKDERDQRRILDRMSVTKEMLSGFGVPSCETLLSGETPIECALRSLVIADWTAYHLALSYGMDPDNNPTVEEFKKMISR